MRRGRGRRKGSLHWRRAKKYPGKAFKITILTQAAAEGKKAKKSNMRVGKDREIEESKKRGRGRKGDFLQSTLKRFFLPFSPQTSSQLNPPQLSACLRKRNPPPPHSSRLSNCAMAAAAAAAAAAWLGVCSLIGLFFSGSKGVGGGGSQLQFARAWDGNMCAQFHFGLIAGGPNFHHD